MSTLIAVSILFVSSGAGSNDDSGELHASKFAIQLADRFTLETHLRLDGNPRNAGPSRVTHARRGCMASRPIGQRLVEREQLAATDRDANKRRASASELELTKLLPIARFTARARDAGLWCRCL